MLKKLLLTNHNWNKGRNEAIYIGHTRGMTHN